MNVVQDKYTNGGKHENSKYSSSTVADTTLEIGPTGGWFAVTTRPIYNEVGGFIFRPYSFGMKNIVEITRIFCR